MKNLSRLVYVSRSTRLMTKGDLEALSRQISKNNEQAGLTGMLLYKDRVFFQILEGESELVESTFESILEDPRHFKINVLKPQFQCAKRLFAEWTFSFYNADLSEAVPSKFVDFFDPSFELNAKDEQDEEVIKLLKRFKEVA